MNTKTICLRSSNWCAVCAERHVCIVHVPDVLINFLGVGKTRPRRVDISAALVLLQSIRI